MKELTSDQIQVIKEILPPILKEIEAIKEHATDEEKSKLNFNEFNPFHTNTCIYGQMAKFCRSQRAIELIHKCCQLYLTTMQIPHDENTNDIDTDEIFYFKELMISHKANVDNDDDIKTKIKHFEIYSSLENFISSIPIYNKEILEYIKGNIESEDFILNQISNNSK